LTLVDTIAECKNHVMHTTHSTNCCSLYYARRQQNARQQPVTCIKPSTFTKSK